MSTAEVLSPTMAATPQTAPDLHIQTRPPVDQDGAFLQDKVLKSGWLQKRTRKTKGWKRRWFVLRADRLSCYKDQKEYKVHRQIYLSDVTAVATLKDAKRANVFGVFSQSKNFHFRADSNEETKDWVEKIRSAAAVEVTEEEMLLSPTIAATTPIDARLGSSSSEVEPSTTFRGVGAGRASTQTLDYSGPDVGSVSSMSDVARISQLSLSHQDAGVTSGSEVPDARPSGEPEAVMRNMSGLSSTDQLPRVIWHGYLYCLKSKGGVKQWKKYWTVVRTINIAFYKNEGEYRAIKILPLENVVDAVEIDPLSKSKKHCMQVITEAKAYRLAASDEDVLAKALGAMKSALSRSKAQAAPAEP